MTLEVALRPLLVFSNLCGLGPFGVWVDGRLQGRKVFPLYPLIVLFILLMLETLIFLDSSGTTYLARSKYTDMIDTYGFLSTCIGAFVMHLVFSDEIRGVWNRVLDLHQQIPYSYNHVAFDILGGLAYEVLYTSMSLWIEPYEYLNFSYYAIETFTYFALEVTSYVIFLQFIHLILACWHAFKALNDKLHRLLTQINEHPSRNISAFTHMLRKISQEHAEIVSVCRRVDELFAFQNVCSLALIFLELTYAFYLAIVKTLQTSEAVVTDTLLWGGYFLYKMMATLTACSLATHASQETTVLLQKCTQKIDDPVFANEVEYFTLQLLHNNPSFVALGFFSLDFTLIYSMMGVVTGYLVILVQFKSSESRNKLIETGVNYNTTV